jgi:site-specific DNA-methyltransferase (cytosine-N4-specific)
LFAYERNLAEAELHRAGAINIRREEQIVTFDHVEPRVLLDRVTYFAGLEFDRQVHICRQHEVEARHLRSRGTRERQATRFGVHGFHEYKGKFNPQLARALINVADPKARVVADPYAGSGTALIEALRLGLDAHGRDLSPLAVLLATAKLSAHTAHDPSLLVAELGQLSESVGLALKRGQDGGSRGTQPSNWTVETSKYLSEWFTPPAFAALCEALSAHPNPASSTAAQLSLVALSSILRSVSLQEPLDLRVRRRPEGFVAPSLRDAYISAIDRILAALSGLDPWQSDQVATSRHGQASDSDLFGESRGRRLIITSPPYATALPYIDTDRLSMMALGMTTPSEARKLESRLTGSREWNTSTARIWAQAMQEDSHSLPRSVTELLAEIEAANAVTRAGFRRAAVPALLYRYFVAMRDDFASWSRQLREGERAVVVIGRNRTGAPGRQIIIETPQLLAACAGQVGLSLAEYIPLETWPRYGMHAHNAVDAEDALVLQK